jgi:hypothetical protein
VAVDPEQAGASSPVPSRRGDVASPGQARDDGEGHAHISAAISAAKDLERRSRLTGLSTTVTRRKAPDCHETRYFWGTR